MSALTFVLVVAAALQQGGATEITAPHTAIDSVCADFDRFVEYLEETHPDPYTAFGGRPLFYQEVSRVRESLRDDSVADRNGLAQRISGFIARLHDGHTFVNGNAVAGTPRYLPLRFRHVADALIVREAPDSLRRLVGGKVISVDGADLDVLMHRMSAIVTSENSSGTMENLRYHLNDERYLKRLTGVATDSAVIEVGLPDGSVESVELPFLSYDEVMAVKYAKPERKLSLPKGNLEYCFFDDGMTAYFRLKSVNSRDNFDFMRKRGMDFKGQLEYYYRTEGRKMTGDPDKDIDALPVAVEAFGTLLAEMSARKSKNLIIDLRGNGGGWTPIVLPMIYQLYGNRLMSIEGASFYRRISPLYLGKMNMTLSDLNARRSEPFKMGDFMISSDSGFDGEPDETAMEAFVGSLMTLDPEALRKQKGKPVYSPEMVYVVTDGPTFSAAFHTAYYLWLLGAKIAGTASSQAPDTFMEVTEFTLPYTGLTGSISNSLQLFLPPDHPSAKQLEPDLKLDWKTMQKYGYDPDAEILMILDAVK